MKKLTILGVLVSLYCAALAQKSTIKGILYDSTEKKSIAKAIVLAIRPIDSLLIQFTRSDESGSFELKNMPIGQYVIVTQHPYYADWVEPITINLAPTELGTIGLTNKIRALEAVIVRRRAAITIKGDTTSFLADSFKLGPNATAEDLLKKLPGMQVDRNGEIKFSGVKVDKLLVDGEEFFGDDPGMAVKNLRGDAIKEVQVFDSKSDQAAFTGIADETNGKTINLKLKDDKKKGYFGKVDVSGGLPENIDPRYNSNLMFSKFNGSKKFTAFLLNGNTNQDGLNWRDSEKYGMDDYEMMSDGDGNTFFYSERGDDEPYIDAQNGFIKNTNAGLQFSNKINGKHALSVSPKFNNQIYDNRQTNYTQTQLTDSILIDNNTQTTYVNRNSFKNKASIDFKLDSNSNLKITANANFSQSESEELNNGTTTGGSGLLKNLVNKGTRGNNEASSFSLNAMYRYKFKKARRTLSLTGNIGQSNSENENLLQSANQSYFNGNASFLQNINQLKQGEKNGQRIGAVINYTEPLNKKLALEFNYDLSVNNSKNSLSTFDFSNSSGKYDVLVDTLSNQFDQRILVHKPGLKLSYNYKKIRYTLGGGFAFTQFDLANKSTGINYDRNFLNIFPTASLRYTYKANNSIGINYNGNTKQPSLNQLQPLRNNNDFFNQYIGNPNLKPSFENNINISHNTYNFLKETWSWVSLNSTFANNEITNNRIINTDSGTVITQPVNTNGNYNIGFWGSIGKKIKKLNLQVGLTPNFNLSRRAEIINGVTYFSNTNSFGTRIELSKNKDKAYDWSIRYNFSLNNNRNNQTNQRNQYFTQELTGEGTYYFKKNWIISSDIDYLIRQKTVQFPNPINNVLWNAKLQRNFKKDEFSVYVSVRDILNQNIGLERNFWGNTISETRNDRLKRFALIGFVWNFKNGNKK